ncbi:CHAT domain-containing protein [Pseudorhodoferax sp.]|uniref:DUF7379 domain-containing protein n=1 Tax=Pseudorhodoferax sp. TaxID=1993553 RepID=UPI0039E58050
MADAIELRLKGRQDAQPALPALLQPARRSAPQDETGPQHDFLPPGYLKAISSYDVGASARGNAEGRAEQSQPAAGDEVVVLELEDGSSFIGNARRLHEALEKTHPELLGPNREILLEKLRADAAAPRGFFGDAVGGLVRKVFTLVVGDRADDIMKDALKDGAVQSAAELGVSWLGTKALMAAVESRLNAEPGALYRWSGLRAGKEALRRMHFHKEGDVEPTDRYDAKDGKLPPMLVFVHGTGSSTQGSFGDLREADRDLWGLLERRFGQHIYAFEHRTLSESPIGNALALARALPQDARICLVTHSRGGLVGDLLCLADFGSLVKSYAYPFPGTGDADPKEAERVLGQMADMHARQREELLELCELLRQRRIVVERYVRVASPANGTLLASANFDLFLSSLLSLIGLVPYFFGNPYYAAFKRVVIDIAKNRTNPHLVPGIEAMLPDSPMARLLREAPVQPGIRMAVVAGDIEGGSLLARLGVLLTDFVFFDNTDNDLVVDTRAMLSGVAPKAQARVLFDRGSDVSHFRYFDNLDTRSALRDWLVVDDTAAVSAFTTLPSPAQYAEALALAAASRDATAHDLPVVVLLPGVMGSHLKRGRSDRVWFDPADIATGGLKKIKFGEPDIEAEELFSLFYGPLCRDLLRSHRVERFAYDWRQPLDVLAERLATLLDRLLRETDQPIRLLAHSMGGLVVRAAIHKRRPVMDALMRRDGARLVMLGTPHQGAHSMVENLIGKGDMLRTLVRLDVAHDMQEVLDIVAGFRGALQLLPKPGFKDMFQGDEGGGGLYDYQQQQTWIDFKGKVRDFWFGHGKVGQPGQDVLDAASWLWTQDGAGTPALPEAYAAKSIYVFGVARNTPCGVREENNQLKMVGTTRGDGTVTWASGRIGGIGSFYYMDAGHGDLTATPEHFDALVDLLTVGSTAKLSTAPPARRAIEQTAPMRYDAGPPTVDDVDALQRGFMGGSVRQRVAPRAQRRLAVSVKAMDLRFVSQPIMVGHYEQDTIAGPQSLIDQELLQGQLSERFNLGLYTGPLGTATSVLCAPNELERRNGLLRGAIVTGLGPYDGALSQTALAEAVRTGVLRYLLQTADVLGRTPRDLPLATLLLGYNSSANMTIPGSVEALVRGVLDANAKFHQTTGLPIRVTRLDIVELYLDTAITAVYALRELRPRLEATAAALKTALVLDEELRREDGCRQRLFESRSYPYWPRLMITDADAHKNAPPAAAGPDAPRTRLATRLRFLYVGQRARAESQLLQRQPELVEQLVRQQIASSQWQDDFGRMLFQLMVPHDFKDAARELARVVLVVDETTANLPWELMLADDPRRSDDDRLPMALRTAVVRQLASNDFRRGVREGLGRDALVIGNPSLDGFVRAFPGTPERPSGAPDSLPGAEAEARAVVRVFEGLGYKVEQVIGADQPAKNVLAALYRKAYRFLHISAHGVFELLHADGQRRSGVLLSDGLLVTAAEIEAMEAVPEMVFLNCCHLGKIGFASDGNKLAASVARELIRIGVRCVLVAGWAVSDDLAQLFGQTVYEELLLHRRSFGEAVFEARRRVWRENAADITWGAFQAYGDPGWLAEPRADGADGPGEDGRFASPDEFLDRLARIRVELRRPHTKQAETGRSSHARQIEQMVAKRCPPGWIALPAMQSALGAAWFDLNLFEQAREAYLRAVQIEDSLGQVPIRDIERLANIEARLGAKQSEQGDSEAGEALIRTALARLENLDRLLAARADDRFERLYNSERSALRASAYKRLAGLYAGQMLAPGATAAQRRTLGRKLDKALQDSAQAYAAGERDPATGRLQPYPGLNHLALQALLQADAAQRQAAVESARLCGQEAAQLAQSDPTAWNLIMQPEAVLVERLLDGTLAQDGETGKAAMLALQDAYTQVMGHAAVTPNELDSVGKQLELLSLCADALRLITADKARQAMLDALSDRLLALSCHLHPGRPLRQRTPPRGRRG